MAMATCSRWNLLLVVLVVVAAAGVDYTAAFDQDHTDWMPITDLDAPRMQELARWAVKKHNEQGTGERLWFLRVSSGQYKIDAPALNYVFVIETTNVEAVDSTHTAKIFVQYWTNTQRLDSFQ